MLVWDNISRQSRCSVAAILENVYQIVRSPNSLAEIYKTTQKFQDSKALLNQKFTSDRLKQELATNNYFIVHITLRCPN